MLKHPRFVIATAVAGVAAAAYAQSPYAPFPRGPSTDPNYFPIGIWFQQPTYAAQYKAMGVNFYMGLFGGPTESDLSQLAAVGMRAVCDQNSVGLAHINDPTIMGWLLPDEPDNAQWNGSSYDPPWTPADVQEEYDLFRSSDSSRPAVTNFGQGVAFDEWVGRGTRTNHPEDYPQYLQHTDIASFDIYPVNNDPPTQGQLWRVGYGMKRLKTWQPPGRAGWGNLEVSNTYGNGPPTPAQVKSEVWLSLVNGASGLIYFTHQFEPTFNDRWILTNEPMKAAVTAINQRVTNLAPALNSSNIMGATTLSGGPPVQFMEKRIGDDIYIFAVGSTSTSGNVTIANLSLPPNTVAEVLDERRSITVTNGQFTDNFGSYGVHLYRITQTRSLWSVNGDGSWSSAGNWSNGVPNGQGRRATLGSAILSPRTTTLDTAVTLGSLRFQGTATHTLSGSQMLTLRDPAVAANIDVTAGASGVIDTPVNIQTDTAVSIAAGGNLELRGDLTANGTITLTKSGQGVLQSKHYRVAQLDVQGGTARVIANGTDAATSKLNRLSIAAGATLDLTNNSAILDYSLPGTLLEEIRQHLRSGRLTSSVSDATKRLGYADNAAFGLTSFAGQPVDSTSILMRYTLAGDTNLDGKVTITDLGNFASHWQQSATWAGGDFNYDGTVTISDLGDLASNWQSTMSLNEALAMLGLPTNAIPEPRVFGLLTGAVLLPRRKNPPRTCVRGCKVSPHPS